MDLLKRSRILLIVSLLLAVTGCATTGGFFGDAAITARVKTAIFNEPALKVMNVSVSTEDNVVYLSGTVKSRAERAKVIQVARKVEGVKAVKSELQLTP
jgi:osmotically-inducible protein OsmY